MGAAAPKHFKNVIFSISIARYSGIAWQRRLHLWSHFPANGPSTMAMIVATNSSGNITQSWVRVRF